MDGAWSRLWFASRCACPSRGPRFVAGWAGLMAQKLRRSGEDDWQPSQSNPLEPMSETMSVRLRPRSSNWSKRLDVLWCRHWQTYLYDSGLVRPHLAVGWPRHGKPNERCHERSVRCHSAVDMARSRWVVGGWSRSSSQVDRWVRSLPGRAEAKRSAVSLRAGSR